ncbi:hypothetical protein SAMD00019534_020320 [Acytostelium subglobosum LB1]|uniref:hypothetical protein n=1 Tax=Acytostelium subglobosum LB1 TaxID=1410327 RepID=UPI000644C067|nr:hypothetical protein SAMD00019534_020320 [Acytostelium subglobosum LB1]GAM18857.1 hypothetical protein SAMD00019534_020320 [Acytostelium subglobosum LB1]|eukprot:XP_012758077.1 hypothetical protein SAMD00019534_020320 [Acytostelium subglobosum LB1]
MESTSTTTPTSTSTTSSPPPPQQQQQQQNTMMMIRTSLQSNKLEIDDVVLKDTYVLRNLKITSLVDHPVTVSLRSDLQQIAFQSTNENLQDTDTEIPVQDDDFNQLFNEVNIIDQITLQPHQTSNVVMSFRPSSLLNQQDQDDLRQTGFYNYFEVKGKLYLTVAVPAAAAPATTTPEAIQEEQQQQQQQQDTTPAAVVAQQQPPQPQPMIIDVLTRVCRSQIKVDVKEVIFDDCVVGTTYIKDLTIWNRSEMPLRFSIYCKEKAISMFQFTDYSTGQPMSVDNQIVPSYSSLSMRIGFTPTSIGQSTYKFKLENKNDTSNYELVVVHATVSNEQQIELIQVSNNSFDMGDCYSDVPTYNKFTVKNISEEPVDISFNSDLFDEVTFLLHEEEEKDTNKKKKATTEPATTIGEHRVPSAEESSRTGKKEVNEEIEEMTLNPGAERVIHVRFIPKPMFSASDSRQFRLTAKSFRLLLKYGKSTLKTKQKNKTIKVASRVCTSSFTIPTDINLGDCTVGQLISPVVHITNQSDLPALIQLRYQSKVIAFRLQSIPIPPRQSYDLQMDFLPRKNNPEYRKQITFVNANNPDNTEYLEVRANNMDEQSISVHSRYYHLETPFSRNYIDFDEVIVNCPSMRTFNIKNTSKSTLTLSLSTSLPEEIKLYRENVRDISAIPTQLQITRQSLVHDYITKFFEGEEIDPIGAKNYGARNRGVNSQYLDLALPKTKSQVSGAKKKAFADLHQAPTTSTASSTTNSRTNSRASSPTHEFERGPSQHSNVNDDTFDSDTTGTHTLESASSYMSTASNLGSFPLSQLVTSFEDNTLPLFTDFESETSYIQSQIEKYKRLEIIVQSGQLMPANTIELACDEEITIYIVFVVLDSKRPWLGGKLKNMEAKLFITLQKQNDKPLLNTAVREMNITTKVCKSIMDLAQRNINFGSIVQYDYRTKTLVINNLTQVPLIYRIKKSGSITSGNLNITSIDRMGIVRPFRKREVQFVFKPTFSGIFDEKLIIENIYDSGNNQTVHIKANVKRPRHFFLNTLDIDFGPCLIKGKSITKRITLTNTSTQKRVFKIIDDTPSTFESCLNKLFFRLEERGALSISKEAEMEIDMLERKLKICRRKGQHEKALKLNMQIEKLRNSGTPTMPMIPISRATSPALESEDGGNPNPSAAAAPAPSTITPTTPVSADQSSMSKVRDNSITFEVDGGGIQNILVYFAPIPKPGRRQWYGKEEGTGSILVYESKNIDVTKKLNYAATICFDEETYRQNMSQSVLVDDSLTRSPMVPVIISPAASPKSTIVTSTATLIRPIAAKPAGMATTMLTLTPPKLDLGEVRVYEDIPFRFTLANHSGFRVNYELTIVPATSTSITSTPASPPTTMQSMCPLILKQEKQGVIEPYGRRNIEVVCQPQFPGKQTHTILVKSSSHATFEASFQVTLSPRPPQYVLFPDLPSSQILDFGDCYYDKSKKFSKTSSFRLDNLSHKSLYISMKSNLSMQIFIFQDEKLTKPADNIFLKGYEKSLVYICLQPSMTSENYIDGHCRELVGGIRVKVHDTEHHSLYENTIKFTALVGKSIIRVGKTLIDLGSTRNIGDTVSGSFNIANVTTLLPLTYTITHSKNLKLSKVEGTLDGAETPHGMSKERIHFSLHTPVYGLYEEKVIIANLACPGQKLEVNIRLLVDDASLLTNLPLNSNSCDILKFEDIYVEPLAQLLLDDKRATDFSISRGYTDRSAQASLLMPFTMRNFLKYDIRIYPKSNLHLILFVHEPSVEELASSIIPGTPDKRRSIRLCGKPFVLSSDQKIMVYPHPPQPESLLTPKKKTLLWKGRKVQYQGTLVFERSDSTHYPIGPAEGRTHISKLVTISGSYCMSLGELTEQSVDIGRIGYENSWKEVSIMVEIQNLSEIPLLIKIMPLPSKSLRFSSSSSGTISTSSQGSPLNLSMQENFTAIDAETPALPIPSNQISVSAGGEGGDQSLLEIGASESKQLLFVLDPKKIEQSTAGPLTLPIDFENMYNRHNNMRYNIKLQHTLRVITFGRLVDNEFIVPTLYHPPTASSATQSDEWFTIENTSNKSLKINVDVELLPHIQELINVEVIHKSSNAPIPSFSLRPSELIEVRVRAKPKPDSKLPQQYDLLSQFGRICINTNLYPIEVVPLRGSILPGQTFSLSVSKINFNSMARLTNSDGTEEQSLQSILSDNFKIRNPSSHFSLRYRVEAQLPNNATPFKLSITPEEGEVAPNESKTVDIKVELPEEDMPPSSTFNVVVTAIDSFNKEAQKLSVYILGGIKPISSPPLSSQQPHAQQPQAQAPTAQQTTPVIESAATHGQATQQQQTSTTTTTVAQQSPATSSPTNTQPVAQQQSPASTQTTPPVTVVAVPTGPAAPQRISLKGCTPIPKMKNCYEINLNQQEYTPGTVQWELTLENVSGKSVEYFMYTTKQTDEQWLSMSRNSGKIESQGRHNITLTFSTKRMDMYSAYLIVENKSNPSDQKTIHITMDVVAKLNTHFNIMVDGRQQEASLINLGDVFYNTTYTDRSFIVSNTSSMPLDFLLTTSLPPTDQTEVCFSLSRSYLRSFNSLYVNANSSVKVFIFFHPSGDTSTSEDHAVQKDIKIFVNCRLIRDFQHVITLLATCRNPQIRLSDYNTVFIGRVITRDTQQTIVGAGDQHDETNIASSSHVVATPSSSNSISTSTKDLKMKKSFEHSSGPLTGSSAIKSSSVPSLSVQGKKLLVDIEFQNDVSDITIYNNFTTPLSFCLRSNPMFFVISGINDGVVAAGDQSFATISVQPNIQVILENSNLLLKEKYLEEYIILYNKNRLSEKYVISLRITIGNLTAFSSSSGLKGGYHYRNLEYGISRFNRKFKKFWWRVGGQADSLLLTGGESAEDVTSKSTEKMKELFERGAKEDGYDKLVFDLHHVTNELILFGLKKQVGQLTSQLASLFYCNLFKQNFKLTSAAKINTLKSTPIVQSCIKSLNEFLSYFPEKREDLVELRNIQDQFSGSPAPSTSKNDDTH